eukprot:5686882-Pleurochrysis_carterae.AAC.1
MRVRASIAAAGVAGPTPRRRRASSTTRTASTSRPWSGPRRPGERRGRRVRQGPLAGRVCW